MNRSRLRFGFLLNALALAVAWLAPWQLANAQCPQICDSTSQNTAFGVNALPGDSGNFNTAFGFNALFSNTTGTANTSVGFDALFSNTTGNNNTASGTGALQFNTTGHENTATGVDALFANTTGSNNIANGAFALAGNETGINNTATGEEALESNTIGQDNTATGVGALHANTTGSGNIALGNGAGRNLTIGDHNIDIGNQGVAAEANTIRIGTRTVHTNTYIAGITGVTVAGGVGVIIDSRGHLGTVVSSVRFKDEIKPMDKASEAILALKPVTFRYKHEFDPEGIPQFGLVAEEVEKVNPALVARDADGKPYTVHYEAVNAMLLNEFLKDHRKVEQLTKDFESKLAEQQKALQAAIAALKQTVTAQLNEQAAQIQKLNAQLELSKPLLQTIANNQ